MTRVYCLIKKMPVVTQSDRQIERNIQTLKLYPDSVPVKTASGLCIENMQLFSIDNNECWLDNQLQRLKQECANDRVHKLRAYCHEGDQSSSAGCLNSQVLETNTGMKILAG